MVQSNANRFQYHTATGVDGVTLLRAEMVDFRYPRHAHEEYCFGVTLRGDQHFFRAGETHRSRPGNVILFNPEDVHDGHSAGSDSLRYWMLYIDPALLRGHLAATSARSVGSFRIPDAVSNDSQLRLLLLRTGQLVRQAGSDGFAIHDALYQLSAYLVTKYAAADTSPARPRPDPLLLKARDHIREMCAGTLSLDQISHDLGMSKYHFLRRFHRQFDLTPYQYVLNCRINRARRHLMSDRSISEVVYENGFADQSHFNRRFRSLYGATPGAYRTAVHRRND
jgi:AraC-like DNA-binding protein